MFFETVIPSNDPPGSFSTRKQVMRSSGVRAISMTRDDRWPLVTQNLVPLTTHSSPSRSARHRMAPVSLPASGSDSEKAARNEPSHIRGRNRWRCSSVPNRPIMVAPILCVLRMPARDMKPREISSMIRA